MPGVTKEGKPAQSYGYDIGGKTESITAKQERGDSMPPHGQLGKLDEGNTNRFYERKGSSDGPAAQYGKTGYESTAFDKSGNVKSGPKGDVSFLEKDGTWAPAEGRGSGTSGNVMPRGKYSGAIQK